MSSQKKSSRLEGKDLITIGIYTRSEEHTSELQSH